MEKLLQILLYHILPALLLIYLGFGALLWWFQRDYIFLPSERPFADCPELTATTQIDRNGTRAYYKDNGGPVVVFYHGNGGRACDRHYLANEIERMHDLSYLFVEYTGYADDRSKPSAEAIRADVTHMVEFLSSRTHPATILMSESIGSGAAAYHASLGEPDGMVLFAPMYSLEAVARAHYPLYPVSLLLREKLPVAELITSLNLPMYIIHGNDDNIIPIAQSRMLFDELQTDQKVFTEVPGAGHNDLYGHAKAMDAMHTALRSIHETATKDTQ